MSGHVERGVIKVGSLPKHCAGKVVKGFGRGSKELGCPTANLSPEDVDVASMENGVYYGWALLRGSIFKTALSVGWNPFYKNTCKTFEAHLIDYDGHDFYDEQLSVIVVDYIRNECSFSSLEGLVQAIKDDITFTQTELDKLQVPDLSDFATCSPISSS